MEKVRRYFEDNKWACFIFITLFSFALTGILLMYSPLMDESNPDFLQPWDHHKYIFMAEHPFNFFIAPFCWRVGLPLLASLLPFSLKYNFMLITVLGMAFSGVLFFYIFRRLGFAFYYALAGTAMFYAIGWIVQSGLINFWVPNASVFFLILLAIYFIVSRNDLALAGTLAIGVIFKESALFAAPLFYTFNARKVIDWRTAGRTVLLTLPAIAILLTLRYAVIPERNDDAAYVNSLPYSLSQVQQGTAEYNYADLIKTVGLERLKNLSPRELADLSFYPFGALAIILPFFAIRKNLKWLAKLWPLILLVYSQLLFAVSTGGLLFLATPAILIMALTGLQELGDRLSVHPGLLLALPLMTLALNMTKQGDNADFKWLALLLAVWSAAVYMISKLGRRSSNMEKQ